MGIMVVVHTRNLFSQTNLVVSAPLREDTKLVARRMNSHSNMYCIEVDGLDPTYSNAHRRAILIHPSAWQFATYPIPVMWRTAGCFGTSLRAFRKLDEYKNMSNKPMLLWAYK